MATSGKFDMSSASPDRPLYTGGQRGSHLASHLDRSGSFREAMETPMLSSLSNVTRSSSAVGQEDIVNFFQCLRFDPKMVAANHKSSRPGDFKRNIDVALGISMDEYGFLNGKTEEIKRVKAGLRESCVKARERVKIFSEALSVFNKFFPTVPSKKRSRLEGFSGDRAGGLLSSDRPAMALGLGKMGFQNHVVVTSSDLEQPKLGERTSVAFPNKRTRTSLVDVRSNSQVKSSGTVDRDREMPRPMNSSTIQAEDRANLTIGVEGWQKSKMKKRRSGIKPDASTSVATTKLTDGYREPKPGLQQKPVTDSRSRMNIDSHGLRLGVTNDAVSVGKSDGVVQSTNLNVRSSIARADPENVAFPSNKKERPAGSDKDRVNFKAINKANVRDEFNSATPTSSTKMNATVRAPRSGTGTAPKSSPIVPRATAPNDWELSQCTNKPAVLGAKNRKRSAANRSSSPPVAHWAGQRPQKITRTARRTNLMPILPNNDETADLDDVSDVSGNEIGVESTVRLTTNSPQQVKMKVEPSLATLSESEESGAPEKSSKEKGKMSEGTDDKGGQCVQKLSTLGMAPRKHKLVVKDDVGDGVRRQGRTGRGFSSTRSVASVRVEKLSNMGGTTKQLRSARLGFDKTESKPGRPPTRKPSDRKAYKRQKHVMANSFTEFHGGSDDGNEELLDAASSVVNPDNAACSPFWREMEPLFAFVFDDDIAYLKQQVNTELPSPIPSDINNCRIVHNGCGSVEDERKGGLPNETSSLELRQMSMPGARDISLFQRLIMAIIPEDDSIQGSGDMEFEAYGTGFELDEESESNSLANHDSFQFSGHALNYKPFGKPGKDEAEFGLTEIPTMGANSIFCPSANDLLMDQSMIPRIFPSELLYDGQQINEKLHLEIQSIGMSIEPIPNLQVQDGGIVEEISSLEEIFCDQALKKTSFLDKLLKSASEAKELQEKEFHERAHDKLVAMAYEKYLACRGPHATGGKSSSNKMAKQAVLAIVKRTLEQCHMFEETGKSCFSESLVREIFLKRSHQKGVGLDNLKIGDSVSSYVNSTIQSSEARLSATTCSHPSPRTSRLGRNAENDVASSPDLFPHIASHLSEQDTNKEDPWSNGMKNRELLLDDVGGGLVGNSPTVSSGIAGTLLSSIKGKRSERDREGKGHNREVVSRGGTNKNGRPALSNVKGERNSKAKPKQKTAQLSVSVNGLVGKIPEHPKPALPSEPMSSSRITNSSSKEKDALALDVLGDPEDIVFSNLVGIDDDVQGNDLGAWLNIDDDGLQDHDFMGLEIPMDDLSDLNMMV